MIIRVCYEVQGVFVIHGNVSCADFHFSMCPTGRRLQILPQDNFVVLACDGIFDVLTSEEVVSNVIEKMKIHGDAQR